MTADPIAPSAPRSRAAGVGRFLWILLVFGLLCLAAGWWLGRETGPASPEAPPAQRAVRPFTRPEPATSAPAAGPLVAADPVAQDGGELGARVSRLEADQARISRAAVASLAAASLSEAAQSPVGFSEALAAAERVLPASPDLAALRRLAPGGAPTRATLVVAYPEAAAGQPTQAPPA